MTENSPPTRLLVAEDNPGLARALEFSFRHAGFDVSVCRDGWAAWELLGREHFGAVVTDHEMPRMTGLELCRRMRSSERYAQTPIVLVTGRETELAVSELKAELNLVEVMPKPFSPRALVSLLRQSVVAAPCGAAP